MGLNLAARIAGYIPKNNPTNVEKDIAKITEYVDTLVEIGEYLLKALK